MTTSHMPHSLCQPVFFFEKYCTLGKWGGAGLGPYCANRLADTMGLDPRIGDIRDR